jgi:hypothetical protein
MISDFRREVVRVCGRLGCYTAYGGNTSLTFLNKISALSSMVKKSKMALIGCPETSVMDYRHALRNVPEELRSQL